MSEWKIGIVGYGVVGRSQHTLFGEDAIEIDRDATDARKAAINACEFVFLCVPTPTRKGGACDTSIVEDCVAWIEADVIVIRSTVPPGTTRRLREATGKRIVFQPEYIGETIAHPLADIRTHQFIILGGEEADTSAVADMYTRYYHSDVQFHFADSDTAELAKYMENSFYAAKVTFCNEFFEMARRLGVDYHHLRELWLADPRISRDHTFVYGDNRGFSGKCLPKDVSAIIRRCQDEGFCPPMMSAIMDINEEYRTEDDTYGPYRKVNRE